MPAHTWDSLRRMTIGRQFPRGLEPDPPGVVTMVGHVGPIQSQAPRAPFLTASSRLPGASNDTIAVAYDSFDLVRSTSLRGTVHTSVRSQHAWLDSLSRRALTTLWCRVLRLSVADVHRLRDEIEAFTVDGWKTNADMHAHLVEWLTAQGLGEAVVAARAEVGAALFRGHGALLRRPLRGGWHQQVVTGYRTASLVLDERRMDPDEAMTRLVRRHLAAFGPATRRDVAWWTGDGLRRVDAAVQRLGDEVTSTPGPDRLDYLDLASPSSAEGGDPGVPLLPEYDGLLVGYAPAGRSRFADPTALAFSSNRPTAYTHPPCSPMASFGGRGGWSRSGARAGSRSPCSLERRCSLRTRSPTRPRRSGWHSR